MGTLVEKAAKRGDVYELVRLAWAFRAYPEERADIDAVLVEVAQRLGATGNGGALAWILTLPDSEPPWRAVDEAMSQSLRLGPRMAHHVVFATANAHDSAKLRGARLLETMGLEQQARQLRMQVGHAAVAAVPAWPEKQVEGFGGWLVVAFVVFFFSVLMALISCLSLVDGVNAYRTDRWTWLLGHYTNTAWARPLFVFELCCNIVYVLGGVALFILAIKRRKAFRLLAPWFYPFSAMASVVFYAFLPGQQAGMILWIAVIAIAWVLYFSLSKRVRNTFTITGRAPARTAPEQPRPAVAWSIRETWLGVVVAAVIYGAVFAVSFALRALDIKPSLDIWIATSDTAFYGMLAAAAWWLSVHRHGASARMLGFRAFRPFFLLSGLGLLLLFFAFEYAYELVLWREGVPAGSDLSPVLRELSSPWAILITTVVVAPLVEELFFRGLVFGGLRARYDWRVAAVVSAAVFAAFHLDIVQFVPLFAAGFLLAYVYQRTNSVWPGVIVHACINLVAMVAYAFAMGWL